MTPFARRSILTLEHLESRAVPDGTPYGPDPYPYPETPPPPPVSPPPPGPTEPPYGPYPYPGTPPTTGGSPPPGGNPPPTLGINLRADTNVDGVFDEADDALEDDALGKIVFVNDDDDDGNLQLDQWQVEPTPLENDLAAVRIDLTLPSSGSGSMGFVVNLSVSGDTAAVRLWKTPDRSEELSAAGVYWMAYQTPPVIYVEALGVGLATLTATMVDMSGQYNVQPGGVAARDTIETRLAHINLDVNNDQDTDDAVDGFWSYRPGYEGTSAKLSSGAFWDVSPLAPQPLNAVVNGLGSNMGLRRLIGALTNVSDFKGYTGNGVDPGDTILNDRDDVSFSDAEDRTGGNTDTGGAVEATKSYLRLSVRDYAARATLFTDAYDMNNTRRGRVDRQVVRDTDHDSLQDGWERDAFMDYELQFGHFFPFSMPVLSFFGNGTSATSDERADPDSYEPDDNGDGGRNLPAHKSAGDSLTPFQEFRGFILDGGGFDADGARGHAGGHKRLSPAYKEYLWEVDIMDGITHPPPGGYNALLEAVSKDYADKNRGPGVRVYWVVSDNGMPYKIFGDASASNESATYDRDHRHTGLKAEFIHVMFVSDHTGAAHIGGAVINPPGVTSVYLEKGWAWCQANNYDFMTYLRYVLAHETTHVLLNEKNSNGFDDGEHLEDPDEDGVTLNDPGDEVELMYKHSTPRNNNSSPLWLAPTIRRLDLTSKEGVER